MNAEELKKLQRVYEKLAEQIIDECLNEAEKIIQNKKAIKD